MTYQVLVYFIMKI